MLLGIVVKAYSSYYYVQTGGKVTACSLRGRFKKERFSLLVGDEVAYSAAGPDKGVIEEIMPRRSLLRRPMVANVDQVVLTFAAVNPDIGTALVDRFLVLAEWSGLEAVLCVNKTDIADTSALAPLAELYRAVGYPVFMVSAKTGSGMEELRGRLYDRITVFAGPSGAGKSSLLNALQPGLSLVTGEVSRKIGRGKHTTRFAELLPLAGGGFVVDTPGFSLTEFATIGEPELPYYFPDIAAAAAGCKFSTCLHVKEPQCAVKQAVTEGRIARSRYDSYLEVLEEIRAAKKGF
ncbi:ribosome small subunit-dependent GTPase A [Anaeroselena agilis]|uniref:Small ribosomal subunit biogenesis GTPase RsgA n=1 Tax=Anaeroselena agilis TaxID=3063788 RepID=A0ABU3NXF7_9FIRM|nr:ribosome small subunit-dependent GTPase A [Selenomonadales bacterium 4137-cl]